MRLVVLLLLCGTSLLVCLSRCHSMRSPTQHERLLTVQKNDENSQMESNLSMYDSANDQEFDNAEADRGFEQADTMEHLGDARSADTMTNDDRPEMTRIRPSSTQTQRYRKKRFLMGMPQTPGMYDDQMLGGLPYMSSMQSSQLPNSQFNSMSSLDSPHQCAYNPISMAGRPSRGFAGYSSIAHPFGVMSQQGAPQQTFMSDSFSSGQGVRAGPAFSSAGRSLDPSFQHSIFSTPMQPHEMITPVSQPSPILVPPKSDMFSLPSPNPSLYEPYPYLPRRSPEVFAVSNRNSDSWQNPGFQFPNVNFQTAAVWDNHAHNRESIVQPRSFEGIMMQ